MEMFFPESWINYRPVDNGKTSQSTTEDITMVGSASALCSLCVVCLQFTHVWFVYIFHFTRGALVSAVLFTDLEEEEGGWHLLE